MNYDGSAIVDNPEYPSDMPRKPSDSDRSDDCETIDECIMHEPSEEGRSVEVAEPSVDVSTLLGPSSIPAALHDAPRTSAGEVDWVRLHALTVAIEALLSAGLASQARPLVGELRTIVEAARGPSAKVIDLAIERSKRTE